MRRRREWSGPLLVSPRSRRRLDQGPAQDVARAFANNPFYDQLLPFDAEDHAFGEDARLLFGEEFAPERQDPQDDPDSEDSQGREVGGGRENAADEEHKEDEEDEDAEGAEEEDATSTGSAGSTGSTGSAGIAALFDEEELFARPATGVAAAGGDAPDPAETLAHSMQLVYEQFVRGVNAVSAFAPRTPPPPPSLPPPPRRVRAQERSPPAEPESREHADGPGGDIVYVRLTRGDRQPRAVVRLPNGGYSYPPNPLFELASPPRRRSRRSTTVHADAPIMLQRAPPPARAPPPRAPPSAHGVHARLDRLRRQLFRRNTVGGSERVVEATVPPHRILRNRNLPQLQVGRYVFPPPRSPPPPPPPASLDPVTVTADMGPPPGRCAICLETYKVGDTVAWVPCQPAGQHFKDHCFHHACISTWERACANGRRTCPECRGEW